MQEEGAVSVCAWRVGRPEALAGRGLLGEEEGKNVDVRFHHLAWLGRCSTASVSFVCHL